MKFKYLLIFIMTTTTCSAFDTMHLEKYFDQNGNISKEFWTKEPYGIRNEMDKIEYVENNNLLNLFNDCKDLDKNGKDARERLIKMGFPLQIETESGESEALDESNNKINSVVILLNITPVEVDKRFCLLCLGQDLYLIDTKPPITAYLLLSTSMMSCSPIHITAIEKIEERKYRFFLDGFVGNGRLGGEPWVEVHDIDFSNKKQSIQSASFAKDLNGDGHRELIVGAEIAWGINWYWVYSYKDGDWINVSNEFPTFYKTEVKKMVEERTFFDPKVGFIRKALIDAAEKGGVSGFLK